ncbi:MAG: hypothetical protein R2747_10685 [Pyrinomonadaceae bacterium]
MEILILGILLVALMVYVSTRIKRTAAEAFEPEMIDEADFKLSKPAGLLHPLRDDSEFAFEAYSQEYGDGNLRNIRRMQAELRIHTDAKFKTVCAEAKKEADQILSEEKLKDAPVDQRICLIESEKTVDGITTRDYRKIVESLRQKKIYDLKVSVLDTHLRENAGKAAEMIETFTVKSEQ